METKNTYLDNKGLTYLLTRFLEKLKGIFLTKENVNDYVNPYEEGDGISIDEDNKIGIKINKEESNVDLSFDEEGKLKANFDGDISGSDTTFKLEKDENSAKITLIPSNSLLMLKGNDYIKVEVIEEGEKNIQLGLEDISMTPKEIENACQ